MNNNLLLFIATHPLFLRRTCIVTATRDRSTIIESICFADTLVLAFTILGAFLAGVIVSVAVGVIYVGKGSFYFFEFFGNIQCKKSILKSGYGHTSFVLFESCVQLRQY